MKKKRNFLTIISSILGLFVICGAFCCSLFIGSNKKVQQSRGDDSVLQTWSFTDCWFNYPGGDLGYDYHDTYENDDFSEPYFTCDVDIDYSRVFVLSEELYKLDIYVKFSDQYNYNDGAVESRDYRYMHNVGYNGTVYSSHWGYDLLYSTCITTPLEDGINVTLYSDGFDTIYSSSTFDTYLYSKFDFSFNGNQSYIKKYEFDYTESTIFARYVYNLDDEVISVPDDHGNNIYDLSLVYLKGTSRTSFPKTLLDVNLDIDSLSQYDLGYSSGYTVGYNDGYNNGYTSGNSVGQAAGYDVGYQDGVESQQSIIQSNYSNGYADGYAAADSDDEVVTSIFSGIIQVAFVPINFFLSIFNFEILGINISAFIKALFTLMITLYVFRIVFSGGNGGGDK